MGKGKLRLDEGVGVSKTCQGRSAMNVMFGFVQMERKHIYGRKHRN